MLSHQAVVNALWMLVAAGGFSVLAYAESTFGLNLYEIRNSAVAFQGCCSRSTTQTYCCRQLLRTGYGDDALPPSNDFGMRPSNCRERL